MKSKFASPPSLDDIEAIALGALERLPAHFRRHVEGVIVRVEEFPDEETEREMELESPFDLMGLYGEDFLQLIRHVIIHEIGHHFGFSDADMEALEDEAGGNDAAE
jgi:predicted Zn-dependent protease with MMP-like domain